MDNMDVSEIRGTEFQIVIVVDYDDGRMYPLTEDCPKCLLPIGNRKLLTYQLDMLAKSGATEVYIVAPREYELQFNTYLKKQMRANMKVDLIIVDEMLGSADGLRAVSDRIRGDFICLGSDLISQFTLGDITSLHRQNTSDLTMMFSVASKDAKRDEVDQEYIGITDSGRVLMKMPTLEIDEVISISKSLLNKNSSMSLRNDLIDMGVYVMSHWVLEFVKENKKISSIRSDLLPYLIKRQFQTQEYLYEKIHVLKHRQRALKSMESWLVSSGGMSDRPCPASILLDTTLTSYIYHENDNKSSLQHSHRLSSDHNLSTMSNSILLHDDEDKNDTNNGTDENARLRRKSHDSNGENDDSIENDLLRCFALVYDVNQLSSSNSSTTASSLVANTSGKSTTSVADNNNSTSNNVIIFHRILNIPTYLSINRDIPLHNFNSRSPWTRFTNYLKKESSLIGENTDLPGVMDNKETNNSNNNNNANNTVMTNKEKKIGFDTSTAGGNNSNSNNNNNTQQQSTKEKRGSIKQQDNNNNNLQQSQSQHQPRGKDRSGSLTDQVQALSIANPNTSESNGSTQPPPATTEVKRNLNITFKQCTIGSNCVIGNMTKLNNCVIFDNVTIGENCTIQNCVICEKTVIESNCNLNECTIGSGNKIVAGSKIKSETFSAVI